MSTEQAMVRRPFGKWRAFFWPVYAFELKKILPMFFMFFLISFNYSVLRNIKDTLIVTTPIPNAAISGAELISFIKFWGVVPGAVIFMLIFSKFSNIVSRQTLFYFTIGVFIAFFALFLLILYPNKDIIHNFAFPALIAKTIPEGILSMFRIWSFSLFYIFAELWGSVALSLLFWGFANEITKVEESKRFYALFGVGANIALFFSGSATKAFSGSHAKAVVGPNGDALMYALNHLVWLFIVAAVLVMVVYWWINAYVLTDNRFYDPSKIKQKSSKPSLSMAESFKFLATNKYVLLIALIVLCYNASINLIEISWKAQLKMQFPQAEKYLDFMGTYNFYTGATTIFLMLFVTGNLLRMMGWTFAAAITPVVLFVSGAIFYSILLFKDFFAPMVELVSLTPLYVAVIVGTFQNVVSKSTKYALFDPTKEMTYIPLDQESKVKGKAAIDVVGSRLGKSFGSLMIQILLGISAMIQGASGIIAAKQEIGAIMPYMAGCVLVTIFIWIIAVAKLGKEFNAKTGQN